MATLISRTISSSHPIIKEAITITMMRRMMTMSMRETSHSMITLTTKISKIITIMSNCLINPSTCNLAIIETPQIATHQCKARSPRALAT